MELFMRGLVAGITLSIVIVVIAIRIHGSIG
jgi:hypothetical protein